MCRRVVCGLSETIAIFWPTSAFTRVDLPTFGRPTTATMPLRNGHADRRRRRSAIVGHVVVDAPRPARGGSRRWRCAGPAPRRRGTAVPGTPARRRSSGSCRRGRAPGRRRCPIPRRGARRRAARSRRRSRLARHAVDAVAHRHDLGLLDGRTRRRSRRPAPPAGPRASPGPTTEPYSSVTSAMWNFSLLHLAQQVGHLLRLGDVVRLAHDLVRAARRACPGAAPSSTSFA